MQASSVKSCRPRQDAALTPAPWEAECLRLRTDCRYQIHPSKGLEFTTRMNLVDTDVPGQAVSNELP